jgi:protein TonB
MKSNNILQSELIDIIFDGRNKDYGAYELRNNYSKRIRNALLSTGVIVLGLIGGSVLANSAKHDPIAKNPNEGVKLIEIAPDEVEPPKPDPIPPKVEAPQVKTEIFTAPKILEDDKVITPPASQDDLADAQIDTKKQDGLDYDGIAKPQDIDKGIKVIEEKKNVEPEGPLVTVDLDAKFNGNWRQYLERNLVADIPVNNGAPAGRYSVDVKFVVDVEGHVSDIVALTKHGYGMEEEAIRVIRKSAKWEPAVFDGRMVKAYRRQMITFVVEGED